MQSLLKIGKYAEINLQCFASEKSRVKENVNAKPESKARKMALCSFF
jgi:hypothetical protein